MNKQAKIIIGALVGIIVILLVIIIILSDKPSQTDKDLKQAVGIYHNSNWNNHDATLQLNNDMTCKYPNSNDICNWKISDNKIIITLEVYVINCDVNDHLNIFNQYATKESCNKDLETYKKEYDLTNPRCEKQDRGTHEANLINNGILLHDHVFIKIN